MGEVDKEMHNCALSRLTWVTEVGLAPEEGWKVTEGGGPGTVQKTTAKLAREFRTKFRNPRPLSLNIVVK